MRTTAHNHTQIMHKTMRKQYKIIQTTYTNHAITQNHDSHAIACKKKRAKAYTISLNRTHTQIVDIPHKNQTQHAFDTHTKTITYIHIMHT